MHKTQTARLHYHQLWLVIGLSIVCLIIYLSLTTQGMPAMGKLLNDKISHALGYFGLMLWFTQIFNNNKTRLVIACLFILMGVTLEFIQGYGGVRVYEVADMAANATGVILGWFAAAAGMDQLLRRLEHSVLRKP